MARLERAALTASGDDFLITASCGFAVMPAEAEAGPEALRIADRRLYAEKGNREAPAPRGLAARLA